MVLPRFAPSRLCVSLPPVWILQNPRYQRNPRFNSILCSKKNFAVEQRLGKGLFERRDAKLRFRIRTELAEENALGAVVFPNQRERRLIHGRTFVHDHRVTARLAPRLVPKRLATSPRI